VTGEVVRRFRSCFLDLAERIPIDIYYCSPLTMKWKPRDPTGPSRNHPQDPLELSHARPEILSFVVRPWCPIAPRIVTAMPLAPVACDSGWSSRKRGQNWGLISLFFMSISDWVDLDVLAPIGMEDSVLAARS
jgi:hypothetical protein